ncbi:TonB-dependent receptor plug domain-containing protein [Celeribacter indicus]|nr:TonB-dependent receptor [Celeribacter indicus]
MTGGLHAQEAGFSLDPIIVEARDELSDAADRATSMYVSDAELERARTGDLRDVFSGIASVSVGGGIPLTQKIYVNGVDMLNLGVTIDGAAQNNRAFHHVSANAIDPGLLRQVRADATVSPADAGPYALAGSVVFETVDASDILAPGDRFGGDLRLSYADNGETFQRALTLAGQEGGFEWLGYVKRATGDDYESGAGDTMTGTSANLESYLGKLAYESAGGHRIELSGQSLTDNEIRQYRPNFGDSLAGFNPGPTLYETERQSYSLSYGNTLAEGMWDPEFTLGYSRSDIDRPLIEASYGTSETWSASLSNTFHLNGSDTVTAGIDWQERRGNYTSPASGDDDTEKSRIFGLFAQARLVPDDRWTLSFGARFDRQEFTGVTGTTIETEGASLNGSASYAVTDGFVLRGGLSTVFGGIDIEDNYTFFRMTDYSGLESSRANNATLGFDWEIGALTLGGELFVTEIGNARSSAENFDFESRGFNLGATYGWATGFARATLSHSDVEVDGEAAAGYEALDFGAPLGTVIALEVEQQTGIEGLEIGGGLDIAFDYDMPDSADRDLEGYEVVNVFAEYVPPRFEAVTLRLEVENLFDASYADRATYGGEYDTVVTMKEPGRTVSLTAVTRF